MMGLQEDRRIEHIIPAEAVKAGEYHCIVEISINAMFGLGLDGFRYQRPEVCPSFAHLTDRVDEQVLYSTYCRPCGTPL